MPGAELRADFWISEYLTPWDVYLHGVTRTLAYKKTPFQEMYIVETGAYGKALILDGKWQSSTADEALYHEALVHPAMLARGAARKVLVLGGGEGATIREVLRWKSVERVVMVDLDREVVEACREHLTEMHQGAFDDPRVELVIGDAVEFIEATDERWDLVISDLTDPIEHGPSFALFTQEYFIKVRAALAEGGVLVVQAGPLSPHDIALHARIIKTLETVFPAVRSYGSFVPSYGAPWGFALCTPEPVDSRPVPERIDELLERNTTGGFRFLDGQTLLGLYQLPLHVRRAIGSETMVYTLANPPKFFGSGIAPPPSPVPS